MADLYRGRMSLRQVWVRIQALPPDSPLAYVLQEAMAADAVRQHSADVDDVLSRYKPKG